MLMIKSLSCRREEVFGPVLSVVKFKTDAEALALANDNNYGLAGAIMSTNKQRCNYFARNMQCGIVWVNCSQPCFVEAPWGGTKQSGIGRELGEKGIYNYLQPKQVTSFVSKESLGWFDIPSKL